MTTYRFMSQLLLLPLLAIPMLASAQYEDSTSMEVLAFDNTPARQCYQEASIAARIHYSSRKNIETCNNALNRTAMTIRDRAATLANRGIIHMSLQNYPQAIADYNQALEMKSELGELNVNIGNVYFMGKVYDKAVTEYTTALEKKTSRPYVAYFNRAMAYEGLNDLSKAAADFKTALEMMPDWAAAKTKLDELQKKM